MAIRWDKLTVKTQEAFQRANDLASEHGNPEVMPVHLLAALLEDREGIVVPLLGKLGVQVNAVQQASMREIERLPKLGNASAQAHLADSTTELLDQAFKQAANFKDEYVSTEHLLLAITQLKRDSGARPAGRRRRDVRRHSEGADLGSWNAECYRSKSRGKVSGAGALCARFDRAGPPGQTRSRDWPR